MTLDPAIARRLKRNADGLFTAVVQERSSGDVLMVAWMDDDALARTLETLEATYFSRSRGAQWVKGSTSGHTQHVHSVRLDCDGDAVLLQVDQAGGACHTGNHSCFDTDVLLKPEPDQRHICEGLGTWVTIGKLSRTNYRLVGVAVNDPPAPQAYGIDTSFRDPSGNNIRLTQVLEFDPTRG